MSEYIDKAKLYNKLHEREGVIQKRVDETPATINGALSPCYTRYSAQLNEVTRCRELVADFLTADVIPIPDGATNGDMVLATGMFSVVKELNDGIMVYVKPKGVFGQVLEYLKDWWNAPYKGSESEG